MSEHLQHQHAEAEPAPTGGHDHDGEHGHHDGHHDHVGQFRRLFWIMLVLAVPVVGLSGMFAMLLGYELPEVPGITWVSPVLGTVMYVWGGRPFLTGAVSEIRSRQPGMMLLIALAISVAFVASWGASTGLLAHELAFWWELALLVVIMLLGHWIEMRSLARSSSALDSLAALLPDVAERIGPDGTATEVAPADLQLDDLVIVRPGGRVPADGRIIEGDAELDESMITGESRPVHRGVGDRVVAGTVSTDSAIRIGVTAIGDDTALAGIGRLVAEAQASSSKAQLLANRAAAWLFWFALGAAVLTAIAWSILGTPEDALIRTITVLVIACPHALGLAIPLVVSIATERAARAGILVTDRAALEAMRTVDTIVFDKTGTLTRGEPAVDTIAVVDGTAEELLRLAAGAELDSEHPLARAIVEAAGLRGITPAGASGFRASTAVGVSATIDGATIAVGGPALLREHGVSALAATEPWRAAGAIVLHVLRDGAVLGALGLADEVRPESAEAVRALHERGVRVVMLTGDAQQVAERVSADLGIDEFVAEVTPADKGRIIRGFQEAGRTVAMVGDGVNDAPALATADVGVAIGAGTDVAIASAGVVLASSDPRAVVSVIELSVRSTRKMRQNLCWAAGYNLLSVPLAAGVLAPVGFILPMAVGAVLMSLSTIVVAANAQLLRRLDLRPEAVVRR